jgi:hypothetical protein
VGFSPFCVMQRGFVGERGGAPTLEEAPCWDTPNTSTTRKISAVWASCSRKIPMICSSVNLEPFIVLPSSVGGLYPIPEEFLGLRSL